MIPRPPTCEGCPLNVTSTPGFCPDKIPDKAKYLFFAEAPGSTEITQGEPMCVTEDTKVLTADLLWLPIKDINVGDSILTLEETPPRKVGRGSVERKYQIATVIAKASYEKEAFIYRTTQGDISATEDHVVLASPAINKRWNWLPIGKLWTNGLNKKSHALCKFLDVWEPLTSFKAGYLAGLFDGEGHISGAKATSKAKAMKSFRVSFCQTEGLVNSSAPNYIKDLGFNLLTSEKKHKYNIKHKTCWNHFIGGTQRDKIRFLGVVRPIRLLQDFKKLVSLGILRASARSKSPLNKLAYNKAVLLSKESIGVQRVVDIQTTSGTFLANGFLVHNCGKAGFVLKEWMMRAVIPIKLAWEKKEIGLANVLRCLPAEVQGRPYPKGDIKVKAEAHCRQYDRIPDTVHTLVLFGEHSQRLYFGPELEAEDATDKQLGHELKGVMGRVGRVYNKEGRRYVFAPHPAFVLRQPSMVEAGQQALRIAANADKVLEVDYVNWDSVDLEHI